MACRQVKPILSVSRNESRRRVLNLYKAWYRIIPDLVSVLHIVKTPKMCREKLREEFMRHAHVTDLRVIDTLIIKGQMELQEAVNLWKTPASILNYWKDTWPKKPTDFMSKFLSGHD